MAKGTNVTDVFGSARSSNQPGRAGRRSAQSADYQVPGSWDPISICKPRKAWYKRGGRKHQSNHRDSLRAFKVKDKTLKDHEPLRVKSVDKGTYTETCGPITDDCCPRQQQPMSAGRETRDWNARQSKQSFNEVAQSSADFSARFAS